MVIFHDTVGNVEFKIKITSKKKKKKHTLPGLTTPFKIFSFFFFLMNSQHSFQFLSTEFIQNLHNCIGKDTIPCNVYKYMNIYIFMSSNSSVEMASLGLNTS